MTLSALALAQQDNLDCYSKQSSRGRKRSTRKFGRDTHTVRHCCASGGKHHARDCTSQKCCGALRGACKDPKCCPVFTFGRKDSGAQVKRVKASLPKGGAAQARKCTGFKGAQRSGSRRANAWAPDGPRKASSSLTRDISLAAREEATLTMRDVRRDDLEDFYRYDDGTACSYTPRRERTLSDCSTVSYVSTSSTSDVDSAAALLERDTELEESFTVVNWFAWCSAQQALDCLKHPLVHERSGPRGFRMVTDDEWASHSSDDEGDFLDDAWTMVQACEAEPKTKSD